MLHTIRRSRIRPADQTRLSTHLVRRWSALLEAERISDSFWEDVARCFGHEDVSDLTGEEDRLALELLRQARAWMERMP